MDQFELLFTMLYIIACVLVLILISIRHAVNVHKESSRINRLILTQLYTLENLTKYTYKTMHSTKALDQSSAHIDTTLKELTKSIGSMESHLINIRYYLGVAYRDELIEFTTRKHDEKPV